MNQRHLSDDRLIEICLAGSVAAADEHLASCVDCAMRQLALTQLLDDIKTAEVAEADAAFPADRLARQQARILHRIEHEGRHGRVIAFRAGQTPAAGFMRTRPANPWVAGAAAAGLVVGLLAGHFAHDLPGGPAIAPGSQIVANEAGSPAALRAVPTTLSDDEFLGQIELAVDTGPASLRPLDAVTPRAWEGSN